VDVRVRSEFDSGAIRTLGPTLWMVDQDRLPPPRFYLAVAAKGLSISLSALESILADVPVNVDSKELGSRHGS
jgi:hypothetical protein